MTDDQFDRLIVELAKANFALARIAAAHLDAQHEHGELVAAALAETRPPAPQVTTSAPPPG